MKVKQAEAEQFCVDKNNANVSAAIKNSVYEELTRGKDVTNRWPLDEEFERGWLEKMVYTKSRPDRAVMLLRAIDAQLCTNKTEPIVLPEGLTVEHLLPQKAALSDYPYPKIGDQEVEAQDVRRNRLIHTIGNLTLLTGPLNSSVSNGPFADKRPAIAGNSALRLNARFQAPEQSTWSELNIFERGRDLFAYAKILWPSPQSKSPHARKGDT
jgi:hypothetical protein